MTIAEMVSRAKNDYDEVFEAGRQSFIADLTFVDVESNATQITVPEGVLPAARINKIGGMSYKTTNLIPFPYRYGGAGDVFKLNGVTITILDNGGISVVGTPSGQFTWDIFQAETYDYYDNPNPINVLPLKNGNWYTLSGSAADLTNYSEVRLVSTIKLLSDPFGDGVTPQWCESVQGSNISYELSQGYRLHTVSLYFPEGSTNKEINYVIYPMLNEGPEALPYVQYFADLRSASVIELKSGGTNLIPFPYRYGGAGHTETIEGVSFTALEDGGISVVGKPKAEISFALNNSIYNSEILNYVTEGNFYTLSGGKDNVVVNARIKLPNSTSTSSWIESRNNSSGNGLMPTGYVIASVSLYIPSTVTTEINTVIYPMLNEGRTALPYQPYKEILDTLKVPEPIKFLDGYGLGVNSEYYNYIDFERKVFVKRVHRKVFDGTEDFRREGISSTVPGRYRFYALMPNAVPLSISDNIVPNAISNLYIPISTNDGWNGSIGVSANSSANGSNARIYIFDTFTTVDEVKSRLWELYASGNPLVIDYALAEPIETDISAYYTDKYINVEGGGIITVVNEYDYDVPTNISFIFDKQGG